MPIVVPNTNTAANRAAQTEVKPSDAAAALRRPNPLPETSVTRARDAANRISQSPNKSASRIASRNENTFALASSDFVGLEQITEAAREAKQIVYLRSLGESFAPASSSFLFRAGVEQEADPIDVSTLPTFRSQTIGDAYNLGRQNLNFGQEVFNAFLRGDIDDPDVSASLLAKKAELDELGQRRNTSGFFGSTLRDGATAFASIVELADSPDDVAIMTMSTGVGTLIGATGFTLGPVGAATTSAGAGAGLKVGAAVSLGTDLFAAEFGNAYFEYRELANEPDSELSETEAQLIAAGQATIATGLDIVGLSFLSRLIPGVGDLKNLGKDQLKEKIKEYVKDATFRDRLKDIATRYGTSIGAEAATEAGQEVAAIIGEYFAREESGLFTDDELTILTGENAGRIGQAALQGGRGALVLGLPLVTASAVKEAGARMIAQERVVALDQVSEALDRSELADVSPELVQEALTEEGLGREALMSADRAAVLYQRGDIDFSKLKITEEQIAEAKTNGQDVVFNLAAAMSQLSRSERDTLIQNLKINPLDRSLAEVEAFNVEEELRKLDGNVKALTEEEIQFREKLDGLKTQIKGIRGGTEADAAITLIEAFSRRQHQNENATLTSFVDKIVVTNQDVFVGNEAFYENSDPSNLTRIEFDTEAQGAVVPPQENRVVEGVIIPDDAYVIKLFNKANESTVPHELAHVFFTEIGSMVGSGLASDNLVRDWGRIQKFLGVEGVNATIPVAKQEKFARAFETYLFEGKAPSPKLRGTFERYRKWLKNIYKSIQFVVDGVTRRAKNPALENLNPTIRSVFDRMLTLDEDAQRVSYDNNIFAITDEQIQALEASQADKDKLIRLRDRVIDDTSTKAHRIVVRNKGRRMKQFRKEAREILSKVPVYQLIDEANEAGGLDSEYLKARYDQAAVTELRKSEEYTVVTQKGFTVKRKTKRIKLKKEGLNPEDMASKHGFKDIDEMMAKLTQSLPKQMAVEEIAKQKEAQYIRENGDPASLQVGRSMHEYLTSFASVVGNAFGGSQIRVQTQQAYVSLANRMLDTMDVKDAFRTSRFKAQTQRATEKMREAFLREDFPAVMESIHQARLNLELYSAAMVRKDRINSVVRKTRQIAAKRNESVKILNRRNRKTGVKELVAQGIDGDFKTAIIDVAARFKLLPLDRQGNLRTDPKLPQQRKRIEDLLKENTNEPDLIQMEEFPAWITDGITSVGDFKNDPTASFKDLTMSELEAVARTIEVLEAEGKVKAGDVRLNDGRAYMDAVAQSVSDMDALPSYLEMRKKGIIGKTGQALRALSPSETISARIANAIDRLQNFLENINVSLTSLSFLAEQMDGFQSFGENKRLVRSYADGQRAYFEDINASQKELRPVIRYVEDRAKQNPVMTIRDETGKIIEAPEYLQQEGQTQWKYENVLMLALYSGTEHSNDTLLKSLGWTQAKLDAVLSHLTKDDLAAVTKIWEFNDKLWPRLLRAFRQTANRVLPPKVPNREFTVTTKDGEVVELKGGYIPMRFNRNFTTFDESNVQDNRVDLREAVTGLNKDVASFAKVRAAAATDNPLRLTLDVQSQHVEAAFRLIHISPIARDMRMIYRYSAFRDTFIQKFGVARYNSLNNLIDEIESPKYVRLDPITRMFEKTRHLATVYYIGLNAASGIRGFFSFVNSLPDVGVVPYSTALLQMVMHRKSMMQFVEQNSREMRARGSSFDPDMASPVLSVDFTKDTSSFLRVGRAEVSRALVNNANFFFIKLGDSYASYPTWYAAYHTRLDQNQGNVDDARQYADAIIARSQPTTSGTDRLPVQISSKGIVRMFTMFMAWRGTAQGAFSQRTRRNVEGFKAGKISFGKLLGDFAMDNLMSPLAVYMLFLYLHDDEFEADDVASMLFTYQFGAVPLLAESAFGVQAVLAGDATIGRSPADTPALTSYFLANDLAVNFAGMVRQLGSDDPVESDKTLKAMVSLLAFSSGVPFDRAFDRTMRGIEQIEEDDNAFNAAMRVIIPDTTPDN